jgi:hypothetical protein
MIVCVMQDKKSKAKVSTRLTYTGSFWAMEHQKIETRLIDEMFASVMGDSVCVLEVIVVPSGLRLTRKVAAFVRVLPTFTLSCEKNEVRRKWKDTQVHYVTSQTY